MRVGSAAEATLCLEYEGLGRGLPAMEALNM